MRSSSVGSILVLIISCWLVSLAVVQGAGAQSGSWSTPSRIPGLDDGDFDLVADSAGTVHAFNSQLIVNSVGIVYSTWTASEGWSYPLDILLPPRGGLARTPKVLLDNAGFLHLAFFGGDDNSASFYYSKAPAADARSAQSWSAPEVIGEGAITPETAALVGDRSGHMTLIYSAALTLEGNGLYEVTSDDHGYSWSRPQPIFTTGFRTLWPFALEVFQAQDGYLHAVWSVASRAGNGVAVYYARREPQERAWTEPIVLAEAEGFEADTPSVISADGQLFVVYHNGLPTTRYWQRSDDNGDTWTDPVLLVPGWEGSNGAASLVVDSDQRVHAFFGNRTGNPAVHGAWHVTWGDGSWSAPEAITSGPRVTSFDGGEGFDPSFLQAVVVLGNRAMVTWKTDPGAGQNGIWWSEGFLGSRSIPALPVQRPTISATETPDGPLGMEATSTADSGPRATPTLSPELSQVDGPSQALPIDPWLLAIGSPGALLLLVLAVQMIRTRRG